MCVCARVPGCMCVCACGRGHGWTEILNVYLCIWEYRWYKEKERKKGKRMKHDIMSVIRITWRRWGHGCFCHSSHIPFPWSQSYANQQWRWLATELRFQPGILSLFICHAHLGEHSMVLHTAYWGDISLAQRRPWLTNTGGKKNESARATSICCVWCSDKMRRNEFFSTTQPPVPELRRMRFWQALVVPLRI